MDTSCIVKIKAEPGFEIKKEQCESGHIEIKTEESEIFDDKASAMVDIKTTMANFQSGSVYQVKTEQCMETDADFEVLGTESAEEVVNKIVVIKRWMFCVPFKTVVEGTPFVPFKMPFSGSAEPPCSSESSFQLADLMQAFPNIGLVIDLSNHCRTYRVSDLSAFDVQYVHIPVKFERSTSVPNDRQLEQFLGTVSMFSNMYPDKLIGVHDQLGTRATAFMICKAMEQAGINTKLAMKRFRDARGYPIYTALAAVLNGSRPPWIPKSDFTPDMERSAGNETKRQLKAQRKAKWQQKAKARWNKKCESDEQSNTERKTKKQRKAERRAIQKRNAERAKLRSANEYKDFLASL